MNHKIALIGAGIDLVMRKAIEDKLKEANVDCIIVDESEIHDKSLQKVLLVEDEYILRRDLEDMLSCYEPPEDTLSYCEDKKPRRKGQRNAHGWYNWK